MIIKQLKTPEDTFDVFTDESELICRVTFQELGLEFYYMSDEMTMKDMQLIVKVLMGLREQIGGHPFDDKTTYPEN